MKSIVYSLSVVIINAVVISLCGAVEVKIPTVTRLVKEFATLESDWITAIQKKDKAALEKILADDFEMRLGSEPGTPVAREEWLNSSLTQTHPDATIEQMAVHDHGNMAIVSFRLTPQLEQNGAASLFIVDVWLSSNNIWKISTRYVARGDGLPISVPGTRIETPVIEKRY